MDNQSVPAQPFLDLDSIYGMSEPRPLSGQPSTVPSSTNSNSNSHYEDHGFTLMFRILIPATAAVLANWFMDLSALVEKHLNLWNERLEDEYEARQRLKNGASTEQPATAPPNASSTTRTSEKPTAVLDSAKEADKSKAILHTAMSPVLSPALHQTLRRRHAASVEDRKYRAKQERIGRHSSVY